MSFSASHKLYMNGTFGTDDMHENRFIIILSTDSSATVVSTNEYSGSLVMRSPYKLMISQITQLPTADENREILSVDKQNSVVIEVLRNIVQKIEDSINTDDECNQKLAKGLMQLTGMCVALYLSGTSDDMMNSEKHYAVKAVNSLLNSMQANEDKSMYPGMYLPIYVYIYVSIYLCLP